MSRIVAWAIFLFSFGFWTSSLEASPIPTGQDVGATMRLEKTEKERRAMMKKLSEKEEEVEVEEEEVEVEGEEKILPKKPAKNAHHP